MTNMKDAILRASKVHVNPPFRQSVRVERFPTSKMDAARAASYNRSTTLTTEEKYQGVAAAQRRKHHAAGTLTPSARAAQARVAAGRATPARVTLPPKAIDRLESKGASPRPQRPRKDALLPRSARPEKAGVAAQPVLYTGPGAAPDFRPLRNAEKAAAATAATHDIATRKSGTLPAAPARTEDSETAAQPSQGSFATSFQTARSFLSRLSSGMSQTSSDVRPDQSAMMATARALLGRLSQWLGWS